MKFRIAICAGLGFLVAVGWAPYFFSAFPSPITPAEPIVWSLAILTQPIVLASFRFHFGIGVYWVVLANTLTYGLISLIAETMRQKLRHAHQERSLSSVKVHPSKNGLS